jgi:hypothetical protein
MVGRRCTRIVGCLALAAAGGPALGAAPTIQDLRENCMAAEAYAAAGEGTREAEVRGVRCVSYLEGMAHVLSLNCHLAQIGKLGGNVPAADIEGRSPAKFVQAFLAWAEQHPEVRSEHQSVAGVALVEAFPCSDPGNIRFP